jgi:cell division protein FtsX
MGLSWPAHGGHVASTATTIPLALSVDVFLNPAIGAYQTSVVRGELKLNADIEFCSYLDKRQSYSYAVRLLKSEGEQPVLQSLNAATPPPVFLCRAKAASDAAAVTGAVDHLPGVYGVTTGESEVQERSELKTGPRR